MHIDWSTLALQTINVLILVWLLARFLFKPVQAIVAKRRAQTTALLAEAEAMKRQAQEAAAAAERARQDVEAQKERLIAQAQFEAAKEKTRLLEHAQEDVAHLQAEAAERAAQQRAAMEAALIGRVKELAVEIAARFMKRISPEAGLDGFVDGLCAALEKLPAETRAAFAPAQEERQPVEVITAAAVSAASEAQLRKRLEALLGPGATFAFIIDPALIAGIELRGRTVSLRNSLRQDLDAVAADLNFGG